MFVKMYPFGVQIYPVKNEPMVILAKASDRSALSSKNQDKKNALAIPTGIMEIMTMAHLINPENRNGRLVQEFNGSFHEFVGKDITQIEINTEDDCFGVIRSISDGEIQTSKIRASDAVCLSLILNMPIYTNGDNLKNLDEIYN